MAFLGGLKEKAAGKVKEQVAGKLDGILGPELQEKADIFKSLKPADVSDDEKYGSLVVNPIWSSLESQVGPVAGIAKKAGINLEEKIRNGLFHVRNELIHVEDNKVKLDDNFQSKLVPTLLESVKK